MMISGQDEGEAMSAYWKDFSWMAFGLSLHGETLMPRFPEGATFHVTRFDYPLADYRP